MSAYQNPLWLQTGDNRRRHAELTEKILKDLFKKGFTPVVAWADSGGVYAHIVKDADGNRFIILVKGSAIWKDTVSCQSFLPARAIEENAAIVMAVLTNYEEEPRYLLFNPAELKDNHSGFNYRFGIRFINFSRLLGVEVQPQNFQTEYIKLQQRGFQARIG
jgi:hypothetical protein